MQLRDDVTMVTQAIRVLMGAINWFRATPVYLRIYLYTHYTCCIPMMHVTI